MSGYYFALIFLVACILYDITLDTVTGFTFGYVFALFYFLYRTKEAHRLLFGYDDEDSD
jgi:hypothetical protein